MVFNEFYELIIKFKLIVIVCEMMQITFSQHRHPPRPIVHFNMQIYRFYINILSRRYPLSSIHPPFLLF